MPGNAAQISHLLGLGIERLGVEDSLESEVRRRRFWACYLMHCHAIELGVLVRTGDNILRLTMPWKEEDYEAGLPTCPRVCLKSGGSTGSLYGELVKALTFWSEVNALIKSPESRTSERLSAIYVLHEQVSSWWTTLPESLQLMPAKVPVVAQDILPNLLLVHILYRQCLCALHASIVPLFCLSPADRTWISARQTSAQLAYEHACAASELISAVLSSAHRLTAIPSFVAYAAYCGCAIQIPWIWSSQPVLRQRAQRNVRANVKLIQLLGKYWRFTALLESHVRCIYKIHAKHLTILDDEPKLVDPTKLTSFKINARHARRSILGHNDILWRNGDVLPRSGEELGDLGIEEDEGDHQFVRRSSSTRPAEQGKHRAVWKSHPRESLTPRLNGPSRSLRKVRTMFQTTLRCIRSNQSR
ncbi:hypothetical protein CLCR_01572 [Cladophialophora carrionii]|uniref:Transcription factor domain-containing protein n=1 Tax=Cladophialophora carrionii TaxID=86049 RepID=A0A1C1CB77_9EURO|nr:hypothetical protein CLCR_01572 [Cladophialophora carrionii]